MVPRAQGDQTTTIYVMYPRVSERGWGSLGVAMQCCGRSKEIDHRNANAKLAGTVWSKVSPASIEQQNYSATCQTRSVDDRVVVSRTHEQADLAQGLTGITIEIC